MQAKKPLLLRILFIFFFTICTGFIAGFLSRFFVSKDAGLAGGAIVLFYVLAGLIIGLVLSIFLLRILRLQPFKIVTAVVSLLGVMALVLFGLRINESQQRMDEQRAASEEFYRTHQPTAPVAEPLDAQDPIGLGLVTVPHPNSTIVIYYDHSPSQLALPDDSIVINMMDALEPLKHIPQGVKPRHLKLDYQLFYLTAIKKEARFIEVVKNEETGSTMWLPTDQIKLISWPSFLLNAHTVSSKYPQDYLVREEPANHAPPRPDVTTNDMLRPVKIEGHWIYVEIVNEDYESKGHGWLRWRTAQELLVNYSLLS